MHLKIEVRDGNADLAGKLQATAFQLWLISKMTHIVLSLCLLLSSLVFATAVSCRKSSRTSVLGDADPMHVGQL